MRADNVLLLPGGPAVLVDWPHAAVGAAVCDVVFLAPSVALDGGPPPEGLLARTRAGRQADPDAVTALVAASAGTRQHRHRQPPARGMPTVGPLQAAQGEIALSWLAQRTHWR